MGCFFDCCTNNQINMEFQTNKLYGFENSMNNCYMNASLQILSRVNKLIEKIKEIKQNTPLIDEFKLLLIKIQKGEKRIDTIGIKRVLSEINDNYKNDNQEDANEFISIFLNTMLEETKKSSDKFPKIDIDKNDIDGKKAYDKICRRFYQKKGGSFLVDLFYGLLKEETICPKCKTRISVNFDIYNILELPINEFKNKCDVDLKDIINSFYGKAIEFTENENCPKCGEIDKVNNITTICTLPKYLIIHFRRTVNNRYISININYGDKIYIPKNILDCSNDKNLKLHYSLRGVIEHSGNNISGHYRAICLNNEDQSWNTFSDTNITTCTNYKSKIAIILLYELN